MTSRTPAEVGQILRGLREDRQLTQSGLIGVSPATVGKIERGSASSFRRKSLVAYLSHLRLSSDAYERLLHGEDVRKLLWTTSGSGKSSATMGLASAGGPDGDDDDPPPAGPVAALDPEILGLAALAGELSPQGRARLEGYIRALLEQDEEGQS